MMSKEQFIHDAIGYRAGQGITVEAVLSSDQFGSALAKNLFERKIILLDHLIGLPFEKLFDGLNASVRDRDFVRQRFDLYRLRVEDQPSRGDVRHFPKRDSPSPS
jgi:hypothetical protein